MKPLIVIDQLVAAEDNTCPKCGINILITRSIVDHGFAMITTRICNSEGCDGEVNYIKDVPIFAKGKEFEYLNRILSKNKDKACGSIEQHSKME